MKKIIGGQAGRCVHLTDTLEHALERARVTRARAFRPQVWIERAGAPAWRRPAWWERH